MANFIDVQSLKFFISATMDLRHSDQLFVCNSGKNRGLALSKQRLSWVVETIKQVYVGSGRPTPSEVKCHSTRHIATSWAAVKEVSLSEICAAGYIPRGAYSLRGHIRVTVILDLRGEKSTLHIALAVIQEFTES